MVMLFIESRRLQQFDERVRPVFESRGVTADSDAFPAIQKSFRDGVRVWEVCLEVPVLGSIYQTKAFARRPVYIHDSTAHFDGRAWSDDEEVVLQVESIFGRNAFCKKMPAETKVRSSSPRQLLCLAFSNESLTILAIHIESLDTFLAVEVWPNELVPLSIAAQRIGEQVEINSGQLEIVDLSEKSERFVTDCILCEGNGALTCNKCCGSGNYLPRKTCEKCGGTGEFKPSRRCPKCGGSGNFTGKYGDVMGPCRACDGAGYWESKPCRSCDGNGYWEAQPCRACDGEGEITCYHCHGETVQSVRFDRDSDQFTTRTRDEQGNPVEVDIPSEAIRLQHIETRQIREVIVGAERLIKLVGEASKTRYLLTPGESRKVRQVQQMIGDVSLCLQKSLDALDPNPYRGSPITLAFDSATTFRKQKSAIYDFRVVGKNGPWQATGEPPFGELTPLRILELDGKTPLELTLQADKGIADRSSNVTLLSVAGSGNAMTFTIQFPVEVDSAKFPKTVTVLPDQIPPGEKQQIRHVQRFAQPSNQNHAVIPAMVVPEVIEFETNFKYFDFTIGRNRRQAEAVQMGLSGIGLSLLKGPPGTGKTTVITEIVRQRIKMGQRVLVTSKNHQAVVNVLEKLDEVGGIRMARHGSSSEPGEIERRYLTGGVRTRVHEEVYAKSKSALDALAERLVNIERGQPKVALARGAASKLEKHRAEFSRAVHEIEQERENGMEAAEAKFQAVEVRTTAATKEAKADYDHKKQSVEAQINSWQHELESQSRRSDSLRKRLEARSDPESTTVPGFFQSLVDQILPEFMASTSALKVRFEQAEGRVKQLVSSIEEERVSQINAALQCDVKVNGANEELLQASNDRSEAIESLIRKFQADLAFLTLQLREKESELLSCQRDAIAVAKYAGEKCSGDESEEYWEKVDRVLAFDKAQSEKKVEFIKRWVRDLESDSSSVGRCYWDHLQVFFSTCVGIASWKEMVQGAERFDYVIVDEAATVTTGETVMPLMYANAGMLVGDEMQLPPHDPFEGKLCCDKCTPVPMKTQRKTGKSSSKSQSNCWLSTSFFEYLWRERPEMSRVMLDTQYRMNPRIASFVSEIFYPEGLKSGVSEEDRTLRFAEFAEPMCLISTSAYKDRFEDNRNSSYLNDLEARMIRRVIVKAEQQLDRPAHFGIITPYAEQVRQLQGLLKGDMRSFKKVRLADDDIASVNSFQGSQRDVIIVSFVRSPRTCPSCNGGGVKAKQKCKFVNLPGQDGFNPSQARGECRGRGWLGTGLTFVQDLQRLNVALSRAKCMVILVGDIEALTNPKFTQKYSEGREVLEKFEKYVSNTGLVLRVWEVEKES